MSTEIFNEKQTKSIKGKVGKNQFYYMDHLNRVYPDKNIQCSFYALDNYFESKEKQ